MYRTADGQIVKEHSNGEIERMNELVLHYGKLMRRCLSTQGIWAAIRLMKKTRKDVSLHDLIGTDKEGNEITLIDFLGSEADDVVEKVQLKIEKRALMKPYHEVYKAKR